MVRDVFGSLLFLALEKTIDIGEVLKYPLTTVPLSLCQTNGVMQKTSKSKLMECLENLIITITPVNIDFTIIDAMFFLHLHTNLPATYDNVARYRLVKILKAEGNFIHFVTDKHFSPSIKDIERCSRGS